MDGSPNANRFLRATRLLIAGGLAGALIGSLVTLAVTGGDDGATASVPALPTHPASSSPPEITGSPAVIIGEPGGVTSSSPELAAHDPPDLPKGEPGVIGIVATGPLDRLSGIVPVIVRNNTDGTVARISVTGTIRDPEGKLVGTGEDQGLQPNVVDSGELAIGYVYFGLDISPPAQSRVDLEAKGEALDEFENIVGLPITESNATSSTILGAISNDSGVAIAGPISIQVACFASDGSLASSPGGFADKDALRPGEVANFSIDLFGDDCSRYLMGASGWTD